jgi:hypothetical protein
MIAVPMIVSLPSFLIDLTPTRLEQRKTASDWKTRHEQVKVYPLDHSPFQMPDTMAELVMAIQNAIAEALNEGPFIIMGRKASGESLANRVRPALPMSTSLTLLNRGFQPGVPTGQSSIP